MPKSHVGEAVLETAPCGRLLRAGLFTSTCGQKHAATFPTMTLSTRWTASCSRILTEGGRDPEGQVASGAVPFLVLPHAHLRKPREIGQAKAGISTGAVTGRKMQMKTTMKCLFHPRAWTEEAGVACTDWRGTRIRSNPVMSALAPNTGHDITEMPVLVFKNIL